MKRFAIWDKKSDVYTPSGAVFTAKQWMERYPIAKLDSITVICSVGEINGAYFGTLGQLKQNYESQGVDFSDCKTNEEVLEKIEEFEDRPREPVETEPTAEERIAAALEFQNLLSM